MEEKSKKISQFFKKIFQHKWRLRLGFDADHDWFYLSTLCLILFICTLFFNIIFFFHISQQNHLLTENTPKNQALIDREKITAVIEIYNQKEKKLFDLIGFNLGSIDEKDNFKIE